MQSQDRYRIALLSAYAIGLHGIESLIPTPIPWLRIGLANIVTLVTLLLYGFRAALMITLIRVILSSLFTGTFLGPAFIMSLGGGVLSTIAMGLARFITPSLFSAVGLSIIGALFHNTTQLFLAYILFIQRAEPVLIITPLIVLLGTVTGTVNGLVTDLLMIKLEKTDQKFQNEHTLN